MLILIINGVPFLLVFAATAALRSKNPPKNNKNPKNPLILKIDSLDVSSIAYVRFVEKSGKSYKITLDSIKKIACYIKVTHKKTEFHPDELREEQKFILKNYESRLSKENYDLLTNTLNDWISFGGEFEIVMKDKS